MTTPSHRLFVRKLISVGLVEAGDNPAARVVLFKQKTLEPPEGRTNGGGLVDTLDLSSLDDETADPIRTHMAGLEKAATEAAATIAALEAQVVVEGEDDPLADLPEPVAKAIAERDDAIAKAKAEAAAASAEVAKLRDEKSTERSEARAAELSNLLGAPVTVAPVLKALEKADPAAYADLDGMFDKLLTWDGMADLLKEHGDSAASGSAVDQINAYATEIRKTDKELTAAEARVQAWQEHPELKTLAREEGN